MMHAKDIYLRPLEVDDLPSRVKWFNDPDINRFLVSDYPVSLAKTKTWFSSACTDSTKLNLSICLSSTNELIGMTGLLQIDQKNSKAQFYITIGEKQFWGRRLADQVIPLVLDYGFSYLRLNKIYLWTLKVNSRARNVYERNGFVEECCLKQHLHCRGQFNDIIQHSIFR